MKETPEAYRSRLVEQVEVARPLDHVTSMCSSPYGTTYFLTDQGRIFERVRDTRDFNTGPRHTEKWLWREIDGPLTEKQT